MTALETAMALRAEGISCIPVNADKVPVIKSWRKFMETLPTEEEQAKWFCNGAGIALVAGAVQCIDIDEKYRAGLKDQFELACREAGLGDVWDACVLQATPSGGYHLVFKTDCEPIRNLKLAQKANREVLIETRGEGGYFLIAPSKGYKVVHGDLNFMPVLSKEDRDDLLDVARSLNEYVREDVTSHDFTSRAADLSPGDDFDQRGDLPELLRSHEWTQTDATHWRRPGKDRGISASLGHVPGRFYVFSTSTEFEPEKPYKPYAVYAMLEHGGDFKAAMSALARSGYGSKRERKDLADSLGGVDVSDPRHSLERAREAKSRAEQEAEEESLLGKLAAVEFWPGPEPEVETPLFTLAGVEIAHVGNHLTLIAPLKSGKSAFVGAILASTMPKIPNADLLGMESTNQEGKAVIHIDTEQSRNDHHRLLTRSLRRCGVESPPDYLLSFCMTGWEPSEIMAAVEYLAKRATEAFGGVHAIVIDGTADLARSVNDEEEANALERWVRNLAIDFFCCVVNVIHQNPNSDKSRGHLGSQFERKSETVLMLEKENERTVIYSTRTRRAPILKDSAPAFEWSDDAKSHVSCVNPSTKTATGRPKTKDQREALATQEVKTWISEDAHKVAEINEKIQLIYGLGKNSWGSIIKQAESLVKDTLREKLYLGQSRCELIGPTKKVVKMRHQMEADFEKEKQQEL